eukprot:g42183.t1
MKKIDEGRVVNVIYIDFDKVPHSRLISKGRSHGLQGHGCRTGSKVGDRGLLFILEACDQWCATSIGAGSTAFHHYINDVDVNIGGMVSKFADDTKIRGVVDSKEIYLRVQQDLDQIGQWAEELQMVFNLDKCDVPHFGKANQ